ncbi:TetR/AcrR family transcriptional regulator [Paenibacillus thalictri]|uniref:TetR/AcrR family transcriptional regulator n=1 Tax=Paenibacillus thalictri TaxID=2527873 RepID=A0A4Q9DCC1_9BACL|nr:TetR/AcrR family transcriptional regulator [Paenibacillus thalictri]TBL67985.1 TetR/AcrR family transcriptional regulator [Paenibacillus thalictri]
MSPRTKEQNEEIRAVRIQQMLRAAGQVYIDKGITMEMRDVAAQAALGYGTVYHYYKNKYELFDDLLWCAFEQAKSITETALGGEGPWTERLRNLYRVYASPVVGGSIGVHLVQNVSGKFSPAARRPL